MEKTTPLMRLAGVNPPREPRVRAEVSQEGSRLRRSGLDGDAASQLDGRAVPGRVEQGRVCRLVRRLWTMGTEIGKAAMQPLALKTSASASLSRGFGKWTAALQTRRALFRRGASWEVLGSRRGHVVPRSSMLSADRRQ